MPFECHGCRKGFLTSRALGTYCRYCQSYRSTPSTVLRTRRDHFNQAKAALLRRIELELEERGDNVIAEDTCAPEVGTDVDMVVPVRTWLLISTIFTHHAMTQVELDHDRVYYRPSGLPARKRLPPKPYRDHLPPNALPVISVTPLIPIDDDEMEFEDQPTLSPPSPPSVASSANEVFTTSVNEFGVYREYISHFPSYTPDEFTTIADVCNFQNTRYCAPSVPDVPFPITPTDKPDFAPFLNATTFRLMNWFHTLSNTKSYGELNRLVKEVILANDFDAKDLQNFSAEREAGRLDSYQDPESPVFSGNDRWIKGSVTIPLPFENHQNRSEETAPHFHVQNLYYRKLVEVIRSALQEQSATQYHIAPFREYWRPSENEPVERMYWEVYNTDAMIEEQGQILAQHTDCSLEKVVIPILLWSDSTHLTSFGQASAWPIYLYLGNISKYIRCKPSSFSAHHVTYIPKVTM
jgi:Plavaka transposase